MSNEEIRARVTPGHILEAMRYLTAKEMSAEQAKLTSASTQMSKLLTGRLSHLITEEEVMVINAAADLIRQLNGRVEHAKEIKKRAEKKEAKIQKDHLAGLEVALSTLLPSIPRDATDLVARIPMLVNLLVFMHKNQIYLGFYGKAEVSKNIRSTFERTSLKGDPWELATCLLLEAKHALRDHFYRPGEQQCRVGITDILTAAQSQKEKLSLEYADLTAFVDKEVAIHGSPNVERMPTKSRL